MKIEIKLPGPPLVWKAPYVGSKGAFSPQHFNKEVVRRTLKSIYSGPLLVGPVRCDLCFIMAIPASFSKKKQNLCLEGRERPMPGGDIANLRKWIEDCLQGIAFTNDKQIVEGFTTKVYGPEPMTEIILEEL